MATSVDQTQSSQLPPINQDLQTNSTRDELKDTFPTVGSYWIIMGNLPSIPMFSHCIEFKDNLLFVDGKSRGSVYDSRHAWFLQALEYYELPGEFCVDGIHSVSVTKIGDTGPPQFNQKYFEKMWEMGTWEFGSGSGGDSDREEDFGETSGEDV